MERELAHDLAQTIGSIQRAQGNGLDAFQCLECFRLKLQPSLWVQRCVRRNVLAQAIHVAFVLAPGEGLGVPLELIAAVAEAFKVATIVLLELLRNE